MKTIEERADAYVGHPFEIDEFTSASIKRQAFIDGAKEQRRIDIDRAREWLKAHNVLTDTSLEEFTKAMEEGQ